MKKIAPVLMAMMLLGLAGCASSMKANVYQPGAAMQAMKVRYATIVELREVEIEGKPTGAGSAAGSAAGATAGLFSNNNRGGIIGSIAGAVIGGVAGHVAEKVVNTKTGIEITYKLDNGGDTMVLVQEKDGANQLAVGDRIKIIEGSFSTRAVKAAS